MKKKKKRWREELGVGVEERHPLEGFWEILGPTDIYEAQPLEGESSLLVSPLKTHRRKTSICWQGAGADRAFASRPLKLDRRAAGEQPISNQDQQGWGESIYTTETPTPPFTRHALLIRSPPYKPSNPLHFLLSFSVPVSSTFFLFFFPSLSLSHMKSPRSKLSAEQKVIKCWRVRQCGDGSA